MDNEQNAGTVVVSTDLLAMKRLHWLHDCSAGTIDPDGYEWGIYRVKWVDGRAVDVQQTLSDFSDLDAEMERERKANVEAHTIIGLSESKGGES